MRCPATGWGCVVRSIDRLERRRRSGRDLDGAGRGHVGRHDGPGAEVAAPRPNPSRRDPAISGAAGHDQPAASSRLSRPRDRPAELVHRALRAPRVRGLNLIYGGVFAVLTWTLSASPVTPVRRRAVVHRGLRLRPRRAPGRGSRRSAGGSAIVTVLIAGRGIHALRDRLRALGVPDRALVGAVRVRPGASQVSGRTCRRARSWSSASVGDAGLRRPRPSSRSTTAWWRGGRCRRSSSS